MTENRWFTELIDGSYGMTIRVDREIYRGRSDYQTIEIFENDALGRVMVLDGAVMLIEAHEFAYHEMLVHPPLLAHPNPRRVLIIGGGDGGTLREAVKHAGVEEAVLCEIDEAVIATSREFLPFTAQGLDSPKATLHVGDGIAYIRENEGAFDVVIVDSTDPVGFAEGLFRTPFYEDCKRALRPGGVFVQQTESPFYQFDAWTRIFKELNASFGRVDAYAAGIPMYPSGFWTFGMASEGLDPLAHFDPRRTEALGELRYYHPELQTRAFALPAFAERALAK